MISRRMQTATVLEPVKTTDKYQTVVTYRAAGEIQAALSLSTGNTQTTNSMLTIQSTHVALTAARNLTEAYRLQITGQEYKIDYINPDGRLVQVFLSLVKERGK